MKVRNFFCLFHVLHAVPRHMCVSGGKKCSFFGKCDELCFLETPALRLAHLPYYQLLEVGMGSQTSQIYRIFERQCISGNNTEMGYEKVDQVATQVVILFASTTRSKFLCCCEKNYLYGQFQWQFQYSVVSSHFLASFLGNIPILHPIENTR